MQHTSKMNGLADIADEFGNGELRVTHRQNIVFPHIAKQYLPLLWQKLQILQLAEDNINHASDIICCPGLDYCSLATARSIPLAQALSNYLREREQQEFLGDISLNISGCINACGHHHVGNIGILGLDKNGEEYYQITVGGSSDDEASIGKIMGRGLSVDDVPEAIGKLLDVFQKHRQADEKFIQTFRRIGDSYYKEALYETH